MNDPFRVWGLGLIRKTMLNSVTNKRGTLPNTIDNGQWTIDNEKKTNTNSENRRDVPSRIRYGINSEGASQES